MDLKLLRSITDISVLTADCSYIQGRRCCMRAVNEGYRSACIPSKYLSINRHYFPKLKLTTVANYPLGLHDVSAALREIQGVVGILENIDDLEIDVVCPPEFYLNYDLFAQWNYLVPLRFIIPWNRIRDYANHLPNNVHKHPAFTYLSFIRPRSLAGDEKHLPQLLKYVDMLKQKGYPLKVSGYFKDPEEMMMLHEKGVDHFGTSHIYLLQDIQNQTLMEKFNDVKDPDSDL